MGGKVFGARTFNKIHVILRERDTVSVVVRDKARGRSCLDPLVPLVCILHNRFQSCNHIRSSEAAWIIASPDRDCKALRVFEDGMGYIFEDRFTIGIEMVEG